MLSPRPRPRPRPRHPLLAATLAAAMALAAMAHARAQTAPPAAEPAAHQRVDELQPVQPTRIDLLGRPVTFSGSWEASAEHRGNFDLNDPRARDRIVLNHEVKLTARAQLAPQHTLWLQLVGLHDTRRTQGGADQRSHGLERGPMVWQWQSATGGTAVQAGRLPWVDRRAWWWDEDLDGVRLRHSGADWSHELGIAREVARHSTAQRRIDPADRGVWRGLWHARFKPVGSDHGVEGFGLRQHDRSGVPVPGSVWPHAVDPDVEDLRAHWLGLRASGRFRPGQTRLDYWLDSAWLRGRNRHTAWSDDDAPVAGVSSSQRLRGDAVDIGLNWRLEPAWLPAISLGWASGSPGFRQTGLHENKARLGGAKRAQVYGEVLQAELANLSVARAGLAWRLQSHSSVELLWLRFDQRRASDGLRDTRLSQDPDGLSQALGHEWDVVFAWREWSWLELVLRGGRFTPGPAFAPSRRDTATSVELGATFIF